MPGYFRDKSWKASSAPPVESGDIAQRAVARRQRGRFACIMVKSSELRYHSRGANTAERVRNTLRQKGHMPWGDPLWSELEIELCRQHYPDYDLLEQELRRRTRHTIQERCRLLGLTAECRGWTAAEKLRLRKMFPDASWAEICAAFPDRTRGAIVRVAYKWGFRRTRRPYKSTCHEVLDEVRQRCFEEGLSMPDLDEFSDSGQFFSKEAYRRKRPDLLAVGRAAKVFGGRLRFGGRRLRIVWDENG